MKCRIALIVFSLISCPLIGHEWVDCPNGPRPHRVDIKHLEYEGIGFDQGYTSLDLFLSNPEAFYDSLYLFFDGRAHVFNNGRPAVNTGMGVSYSGSFARSLSVYQWGRSV